MRLTIKAARKGGVYTRTIQACPDYLDPETADRKPAVRGVVTLALSQYQGRVRRLPPTGPRAASHLQEAMARAVREERALRRISRELERALNDEDLARLAKAVRHT